ncbi:MAG TPA: aspartyl protease family protein [Rhizomicrobium sp.]|nr:aspartyl protease family protein [Rhizomicrobium sp.]
MLISALALLAMTAAARAEDCHLERIASLNMIWDRGDMLVPVDIQGQTRKFLIDISGYKSQITETAADELRLTHTALNPNFRIQIESGKSVTHEAAAGPVKLGALSIDRMKFLAVPDDVFIKSVDGTIANDILGNYDVEIDPAGGKVNLYSQDHCPGQVVYWTRAPAAAITFRTGDWLHDDFMADLNGHPIDAMIDTASSKSHIESDLAAREFGWSEDEFKSYGGILGEDGEYSPAFTHLSLNGVEIVNPRIVIAKQQFHGDGPVMLSLGMNILRNFHIFISNKDHTIYLTAANAPPVDAAAPPATTNP